MVDIQLKRTLVDANINNVTYKEAEPSFSLDRKKLYVEGDYVGGQNIININSDYTPSHLDYCMVDVRIGPKTITLPTLTKDFIFFIEDNFNVASDINFIKIVTEDANSKINSTHSSIIINSSGIIAHVSYTHANKNWKVVYINEPEQHKPGMVLWTTSSYAGKTEYTFIGDDFPSTNKDEYLLTIGGIIIDPKDYSLDAVNKKVTFSTSVILEDNLSLTLRYWLIGMDGIGRINLPIATVARAGATMPDNKTLTIDEFGVLTVLNTTGVLSATETIKGISKIATQVEATNTNNDNDYITPKKLWDSLSRGGIESWKFISDGTTLEYSLNNVTINDINELFIIAGRLQLIPEVDYTYTNNILKLNNTLPVDTIIHIRKMSHTIATSSLNIQAQINSGLSLYKNYSGGL